MKKIYIFFLITFFLLTSISAQYTSYSCYPTNWWTGMKWNKVQVVIHGKDVANSNAYTINYPGVKLEKVNMVENNNYVFLDLIIYPTAKPGIIKIKTKDHTIDFELKNRRSGNGVTYAQGVTSKDLIYLIMPDRFSNGDPSNDRIAE